MPSCRRICVTLIRKVLAMMNTATRVENARAMRRPCSVEREVSSAMGLRAAGGLTVTPGGKLLDVDLDGEVTALSDGLLVLRREFGFTGPALVNGAVGGGCQRCDAGDIASYIDANLGPLDIDASGGVQALTDGLLVVRRLFGFSNAALVTNAVGVDCTRCDAGDIASHIDGLK